MEESNEEDSTSSNEKELDLSDVGRNVWLVKVPNHVSQAWEQLSDNSVLGHMKITKNSFGKSVITMDSTKEVCEQNTERKVSAKHELNIMHSKDHHNLAILSHKDPELLRDVDDIDDYRIEGTVVKTLEMRQSDGFTYINPTKEKPKTTKQIDYYVETYVPVRDHVENIECRPLKRARKSQRVDKSLVHDLLFSAFEKEPYYHLKELIYITKQPSTYLKECLQEIAEINEEMPRKSYWQLKPEYRMSVSSNVENNERTFTEMDFTDYTLPEGDFEGCSDSSDD